MKILLSLVILTALTKSALAQFHFPQDGGVVISKKIVTIPVDIGTAKIKFTNLGYGSTYFVKLIVPELAAHTILNHRNLGEDGPCLVTYETKSVDDVVNSNPEVVNAKFSITVKKRRHLNRANICEMYLEEYVETKIRGFTFRHLLNHRLPDRVAEDCI